MFIIGVLVLAALFILLVVKLEKGKDPNKGGGTGMTGGTGTHN